MRKNVKINKTSLDEFESFLFDNPAKLLNELKRRRNDIPAKKRGRRK